MVGRLERFLGISNYLMRQRINWDGGGDGLPCLQGLPGRKLIIYLVMHLLHDCPLVPGHVLGLQPVDPILVQPFAAPPDQLYARGEVRTIRDIIHELDVNLLAGRCLTNYLRPVHAGVVPE